MSALRPLLVVVVLLAMLSLGGCTQRQTEAFMQNINESGGAGIAAASAESRHADMVQKLVGPTKELYARGLDKADEFEADRMGVVLAARAGYDPFGLPAALTTLAAANPKDAYLALLFKTHPAPEARIDKLALGMGTLRCAGPGAAERNPLSAGDTQTAPRFIAVAPHRAMRPAAVLMSRAAESRTTKKLCRAAR